MRLIYKCRVNGQTVLKNITYETANIDLIEEFCHYDYDGNITDKSSRIYINKEVAYIADIKGLDVLKEVFTELYTTDPEKYIWYDIEERIQAELERKRKRG